ncbi:hypothetical protein [Streptomyces sp. NPDC046261]|uniref:hypothetical protein n=1 Tax=Streptomyces sp. NPDC046261 TaxID=3157200 RepID=UPI0033DE2A12
MNSEAWDITMAPALDERLVVLLDETLEAGATSVAVTADVVPHASAAELLRARRDALRA